MLRLPFGVAALFEDWLRRNCPDTGAEGAQPNAGVEGAGSLYASNYGERMRGRGPFAEQVARLFALARAKHGIEPRDYDLSTEHFRPPRAGPQLGLFD